MYVKHLIETDAFFKEASVIEVLLTVTIVSVFVFISGKLVNYLVPIRRLVFNYNEPSCQKYVYNYKSWEAVEAKIKGQSKISIASSFSLSFVSLKYKDTSKDIYQVTYFNSSLQKDVETTVFTSNKKYNLGDTVKIKVNPQNPLEAFVV